MRYKDNKEATNDPEHELPERNGGVRRGFRTRR